MTRPHPSLAPELVGSRRPAPRKPPSLEEERTPAPDARGTIAMVAVLGLTALLLQGETAVAVARFGAWGTLIALGASIAFDLRHGLQNLMRADLLALLALYFFTLIEFIFPQYALNNLVAAGPVHGGVNACLLAFGCIAIGRHIDILPVSGVRVMCQTPVPRGLMIAMFWTAFLFGYLNVFLAVDFDPSKVAYWMFEPRFTQPWGRERLGSWKALLHEVSMLVYLVPPMAGIIMARRRHYSRMQVIPVGVALLFVLFFSFAEGTRYIFSAYLVTFVIGFCFAAGKGKLGEIIVVSAVALAVLGASTTFMLKFRHQGLRAYWEGFGDTSVGARGMDYFFVDYNLHTIARLVEAMPAHHDYLGWEVPYLAIVRPIPRALWPGKPEGLSLSTEDVVGADGWTVAATFVGEAYMSGGLVVVAFIALVLGMGAGWWNRFGSSQNSDFGILVYASGFFASAISMRSIQVLTTAMLPTIAAAAGGFLLLKMLKPRKAPRQPPPRPAAPRAASA